MNDAVVDSILVRRLQAVYWPGWCRTIVERPAKVLAATPVHQFCEHGSRPDQTDHPFHLGRVRYFLDELQRGAAIAPIDVDQIVFPTRGGPPSWGPPCVLDGHHRFMAAVLARTRRIPASCSGLCTSIDWLKGVMRYERMPPEIAEVLR
jgi:hypothetical protein